MERKPGTLFLDSLARSLSVRHKSKNCFFFFATTETVYILWRQYLVRFPQIFIIIVIVVALVDVTVDSY